MSDQSLGKKLAPHLPFLRRYARALTGDQTRGDKYVRATLESIVEAPDQFPQNGDPRLALYGIFQKLWNSANAGDDSASGDSRDQDDIVQARLSRIVPQSRQALLLTVMEGFTETETAELLDVSADRVADLIAEALREIEDQTRTKVLIIEDEPLIALDIETIVRDLGHEATATAATRSEAVEIAKREKPGLVLADIQLADNSSGIDAVKDILADMKVPVIFITAFPERLLTGEKPEPAFLITKPFQRSSVKAAIAQALFFDDNSVPA